MQKKANYEFKKAKLHKPPPRNLLKPQNHLSIDLMGPYNTTAQGNMYTLTTICNITSYLMTIPIPDKKIFTSFSEMLLKFSFPRILHSDNGTKFKSKLIEHLAQQLSIKKTFSIDGILEWDQLLPCVMAAFSWFPNEHSQESTHFFYFGCDPYLLHLAMFLQPTLRYLDSDEGMTHLNKLKQIYMLKALNTTEAHSEQKHDK